MSNTNKKCAIVGCGFVGSTIAYTFAERGLFSELILIDANTQKAEGEAMDLNHGMPFAQPSKIRAGTWDDIVGCGIVILAAGANQKEGETRLDLLHKNTAIFKSIIDEIKKRNTECILLVVTNPVDVLTYATIKMSGFPKNRVIGTGTVLDTARFKYLLADHLGVDSRNIHAFILGEHGDSEFAAWSISNVSGIPLFDMCKTCGKCCNGETMKRIFDEVRTSAYKIIKAKGATYYAIAMGVLRITEAIIRDEHSILTVSSYVDGQYGIDDVCMGLPAIVGADGVKTVLEATLSPEETEQLHHSYRVLTDAQKTLKL